MAMNAAAVQKPIRPLVPKFAIKHYQYIRHAMPTLVPMIEDFEDKSLGKQRLRSDIFKFPKVGVGVRSERVGAVKSDTKRDQNEQGYCFSSLLRGNSGVPSSIFSGIIRPTTSLQNSSNVKLFLPTLRCRNKRA